MGVIIDTSTFITAERSRLTLDSILLNLPDQPAALAAITASELLAGVLEATQPASKLAREAFVEDVFQRLPVISFDLRLARIYAEIWNQLKSIGQPIGAHDLMIASTALAYGFSVLTYHVRHFSRVPGLDVIKPDL